MKRSFKCNCSEIIEEAKTMLEGFLVDALICNKCSEITLTPESAKELLRLRAESEKINSIRKIVRIGNSIGVTLPPEAADIGFTEGTSVDVHLIGEHEIVIRPKIVKH